MAVMRSFLYSGTANPNYGNRGPLSPLFKGELIRNSDGYLLRHCPEHPFSRSNHGGRYLEHRLVVEETPDLFQDPTWFIHVNGRRVLRLDLDVHHKNEDRTDNRPENLEVLPWGEHTREHNATKRIVRDPGTGRILGSEDAAPRPVSRGRYAPRGDGTVARASKKGCAA
jgi:hypothetical protein